jgi:acetyl-CoA carboxylase biotin carboxylase subunit
VTEWITGIDLVREMVRIAAGEPLGYRQEQITRRGASIECRIYAEDPKKGFLPSPGPIEALRGPSGPFVRDDSGVYTGAEVSSFYDPLISKLSVWGPDRASAVARMRRALSEYVVTGIETNLRFHERLFRHPEFIAGRYHTGFIEAERASLIDGLEPLPDDHRALAVALAVAVARSEGRSHLALDNGDRRDKLSPWVLAHRARALR